LRGTIFKRFVTQRNILCSHYPTTMLGKLFWR